MDTLHYNIYGLIIDYLNYVASLDNPWIDQVVHTVTHYS